MEFKRKVSGLRSWFPNWDTVNAGAVGMEELYAIFLSNNIEVQPKT